MVSCEAILFNDFPSTSDAIIEALATPSVLDSTVEEIMQVVFNSLTILVNCLLEDHLPGGALDIPSEEPYRETKSVPNVLSERDFAKPDCFL